VVAAAVVLSPDRPIRGLNDSKQLEPDRREILAERIQERAVAWAIAAVDAATIDSINIYQASAGHAEGRQPGSRPRPIFCWWMQSPSISRCRSARSSKAMPAATPSLPHPSSPSLIAMPACAPGMRSPGLWPGFSTGLLHRRALPRHSGVRPTPLHRLSFEPVRARSLFPVNYNSQMELFETAGAA